MSWFLRRRKKSYIIFVAGAAGFFLPSVLIHAEQADPIESCTAIREQMSPHIALGTHDDLVRLQAALDRTERELARLQLKVPIEGSAQFAEKQHNIKELQNSLVESEMLFRYRDRSNEETPIPEIDRPSAEEHAAFRDELSGRMKAQQATIGTIEKEIRSDQDKYRQRLVVERNCLAALLTARQTDLLSESARPPDCHADDQLCLQKKRLRVLCALKPIVSGAERLRLLRIIAEVDSRLNTGRQTESTSCEKPLVQ